MTEEEQNRQHKEAVEFLESQGYWDDEDDDGKYIYSPKLWELANDPFFEDNELPPECWGEGWTDYARRWLNHLRECVLEAHHGAEFEARLATLSGEEREAALEKWLKARGLWEEEDESSNPPRHE